MSTGAYFGGVWISRHQNKAQLLPVIFRTTKADNDRPHARKVTAVLPTLPSGPNEDALTCYESGQHCTRMRQWYLHCTQRCAVDEYMPLLAELCSIYPDSDLHVVSCISLDHDFKRFTTAPRFSRELEARFDRACSAAREIVENES